jgi:hypothetical protein
VRRKNVDGKQRVSKKKQRQQEGKVEKQTLEENRLA